MKTNKKIGWKSNLIEILCIFLAVFLAKSAEDKLVWLFVVLMICLWCVKFLKERIYRTVLSAVAVIVVFMSAFYFVTDSIPYISTNDAGLKGKLVNLTIPKVAGHNDMWISPILEGKIVNLTYASPWCHEYMQEFAAEAVIEEREVLQFYTIIWGNVNESEIRRVQGIDFIGTRDLYTEETVAETRPVSEEKTLFLDTEGLVDTEEVYAITDENYNIYLLSKEMVERILESNEAKEMALTN